MTLFQESRPGRTFENFEKANKRFFSHLNGDIEINTERSLQRTIYSDKLGGFACDILCLDFSILVPTHSCLVVYRILAASPQGNCVPREVVLNCLLTKSFINKNVFLCVAVLFADGHANVEVQLITKKYAEKGSSVSFFCNHNVDLDILYKVMATSFLYWRPTGTFWSKQWCDFAEAWR